MADAVTERRDAVLLAGNPNAGKSTLFNLLAHGHAKVGNWHGVTVGVLEGRARFGVRGVTVCDLPGIYSLDSMSMEEKLARDYLLAHGEAFLLFVAECASLERALPLFFALAKGRRAALILTKERAFRRGGGKIDAAALSERLGVPVLHAEGKRGNLLWKELGPLLQRGPVRLKCGAAEALAAAYRPQRAGLSRADRALTNGLVCFPLFFALIFLAFFLTFARGMPGELMKRGIETLFSETLASSARRIPSPIVASLIADGILTSLGGVLCFLPQIALLQLFLILMEESGLLSRLAYLSDGALSKAGLSGRAVFSLLMGFGCTAAAILTTRGLDDKRMQRRVILCLPYLSCSAKLPVFLTISASFFENPLWGVAGLYLIGVAIALLAARLMRGTPPPFVLELAPLQIPRPVFVLKSLLFQIKQFIIKTATVILAFFLLSWFLSSFGFDLRPADAGSSILATLCGGLKWLFAPIGMGDWRIAYAALSGLVAKENVAGALAMFYGGFPFSGASAFAFSVFLLTCSPCVSAISASARELGAGRAILYAVAQTVSALLFCYIAYFLATGGIFFAVLAAVPIAAFLVWRGVRREKIHGRSGDNAQSVHGRHGRPRFLRALRPVAGKGGKGKRRSGLAGRSPERGG